MDEVLTAKKLTKVFAEQAAVNELDFSVKRGESVGVLGPNGAGKTTLLRMVLGHVIPTHGELTVLGYDIPHQARLLRNFLGVVPQQDNLDPDFSVVDNLKTYGRYFLLKNSVINNKIPQLLAFAALENKAKQKVTTLSGGMKRRLVLARALMNDPQILLLDEPTTGLDPQARQLIWERLRQLKSQGATLILTSHYMEEAERLCDRVVIMDHGKILAQGTPQGLIQQHIEPFVFEVYGEQAQLWYQQVKPFSALRFEWVGGTVFCYCQDDAALLATFNQYSKLSFLLRRGNLEDVFIKLTGRELRDV